MDEPVQGAGVPDHGSKRGGLDRLLSADVFGTARDRPRNSRPHARRRVDGRGARCLVPGDRDIRTATIPCREAGVSGYFASGSGGAAPGPRAFKSSPTPAAIVRASGEGVTVAASAPP